MALALKPRLLMLDEPAAGFSPAERAHLVTLLRELPDEISLLLIEHDMDIALAVATRVMVMHDGEKILEGTPQEIRDSERVREIYLGGSVSDVA
jgi:branched-chain amino acid transport system ATP-binding protein